MLTNFAEALRRIFSAAVFDMLVVVGITEWFLLSCSTASVRV